MAGGDPFADDGGVTFEEVVPEDVETLADVHEQKILKGTSENYFSEWG